MTCIGCQAQLIQQRTWTAAESQQRIEWVAAGFRMLKGHGRCNTCYQRAYLRHELPTAVVLKHAAPCRRCGVRTTDALCVDCTDVTRDLGESARWVA